MASIFVGKLDFGVTEVELRNLFEQYGKVTKASIALDKETKKPRGFAFIEMPNADEAANAIKNLDGWKVNGRQMAVKEAEQRSNDGGNRGGGNFDNRNNRGPRPENNGQRPPYSGQRTQTSEYKKPIDDRPKGVIAPPNLDELKSAPKKVVKNEVKSNWDQDGKGKKKMSAYKKSGKPGKFFGDDEDDDWDDLPYKSHNSYDDEEDDDFYSDEEE